MNLLVMQAAFLTCFANHLNQLLHNAIDASKLIYCTNDESLLNYLKDIPKVIHDQGVEMQYKHSASIKYEVYILLIKHLDYLESLSKDRAWNSRAKFVIIVEIASEELLHLLRKLYVYNVVVLAGFSGDALTYFPYDEEDVYATNSTFVPVNQIYFPEKIPKTWRNTTLSVLVVKLPPYIIDVEARTGLELKLVEEIFVPKLKLKMEYVDMKEYWGFKFPNGSYNKLKKMILNKEGDFGVGSFHVRQYESIEDFDVTYPYLMDSIVWIVPTAPIKVQWITIVDVFPKSTWFLILSVLLILSCFWVLLSKYAIYENSYYSVCFNSFCIPIRMILMQLSNKPIKSQSNKLIFVSTWLFMSVISILWQAHLIIFLTYNIHEHQVHTPKDIIKYRLRIRIPNTIAQTFLDSHCPTGDYFYKNNKPGLLNLTVLDEVAYGKDTATTFNLKTAQYLMPAYLNEDGEDLLYIIERVIMSEGVVMFFTKGHPVYQSVSEILLQARAGGLIKHLEDSFYYTQNRTKKHKDIFGISSLNLKHVKGIFLLYFIGNLLAAAAFVLEIIYPTISSKHRL
ncbi:PREDICTED: uncharacterized protein LOC108562296 [Nicrophorus vespilloides]|uniref:Uncharacterized protein LOC108562296 n=1 Tax=Nicrophorus vespilloides TaxID=110193 RepID=A0ABM1MNC6_NICVS|nr:PREDICTED: uncharacterized protein LOC108562296 [Nicrophorus vespilloides]